MHPKYRTPYRSIVFLVPVAMIFALGVPLERIVSERFRYQGGAPTPREKLLRRVAGAALGLVLLGVLAFAVLR